MEFFKSFRHRWNMKIRISRTIRVTLKSFILKIKKFSLNDSILIISSPRGGSTWLTEILNSIDKTIINWEPFHPNYGALSTSINGGDALYVPESQTYGLLRNDVQEILKFNKNTKFTLRFLKIKDILSAEIVITKSVRINNLIPWLIKHIDLKRKPIYLLRHPIATAFSHIKAFDEEKTISRYIAPNFMHNERFIEHEDYINSLKTKIERQVAIWCLNNIPVIHHPDHGKKWLVVYYENLVMDPEDVTIKLLNEIGINVDMATISKIDFKKPSQTDIQQDYKTNSILQLEKWKHWLSDVELDNIQKIFDHFDFLLYSTKSCFPHTSKIND
ncbi:MAG TPA: hypothetical protein ENI82_03720 [Bacteroidetes bacterium]|nr:hypothetical protein [Bacteroidota bacterium]